MPMDTEKIISKYRIGKDSRVVFSGDKKTYYVKNVTPDRKSLFVTDGNQVYRKSLSKLEKVDGKEIIKENACNCGCGGCSKAPLLNEQLVARTGLSEGMLYHIDNKKPLTEHLFRAGSQKYFDLWAEARMLYSRDLLEVKGDDLAVILETDLGHFGTLEDGTQVPLDFIMEDEYLDLNEFPFEYKGFKYNVEDTGGFIDDYGRRVWQVSIQDKNGDVDTTIVRGYSNKEGHLEAKDFIENELLPYYGLNEAAKKKKKDPPIGKPMRDTSGGKAYKVYVRDPKTKRIKTVRFGSGGLKAKINNPKARQAFAKRHKCSTRNDKTKASYWSCRLPRYAKLLGLKSSFSGFW